MGPSHKIGVFEELTKSTAENLCWRLFLIKLQFWGPATLLKKTPTQVLSCEIYKLFKNNYFEEHLWVSASKHYLKRDSNTGAFLWILWIIQDHLFLEDLQMTSSETPVRRSFFLQACCKPDCLKTFNSVRKRLPHSYFSVNFETFLGKLFCRTPPSNHFSHDVFFPFLQISEICSQKSIYLVEQW